MIILILTDMDSSLYAFIMLYLCLVLRPVTGHQCGNLSLPATITIPETTTPGTPIYELNSTGTETGTKPWTLQNTEYFQFSYQSSIYQLTLTKKIDVNCQKERLFTLDFTCGNQSKVMVVTVPFTDKNVPTWITSNINKNLELNESLLLGTPVLDLDGAVDDRDCYKDGNIIEVARYTAVNQHDASSFFSYNATSKQVYLSRVFDYDEMYCDFNFKLVHGVLYFNLKLYPDNDPKSISQEKITVNFTDVDDEPPVFLKYKGCKECLSKCKSTSQSHTIRLERDIQSNLTFETMAKDFDTEEEDLEYTIIEVIPDYLLNYVDIDSQNGTVNLQISEGIIGSGNDTVKLDQINIVLQVADILTNQTSENYTLQLIVKFPSISDPNSSDSDLPLTVLIIIFVVVGVALILFAVITIIRVRRVPNKTVYKVKTANANTEVMDYGNMFDINFVLKEADSPDIHGETNNGLIGEERHATDNSSGNESGNPDVATCEGNVDVPEVDEQNEVSGPDEYPAFAIDDVIGDENDNDEVVEEVNRHLDEEMSY